MSLWSLCGKQARVACSNRPFCRLDDDEDDGDDGNEVSFLCLLSKRMLSTGVQILQ